MENNIFNPFIFNLRIWRIHLQIQKGWSVKFMFAWFDMWIGLFVDTKKRMYYFFPLPMVGFKTTGLWIAYNSQWKFRRDAFVHLFNWGSKYWPMTRKY